MGLYRQEEVFTAIALERDYQDKKYEGMWNDANWSVEAWIVFIERYIQEAKSNVGHDERVMASIRKAAALAVASMEHNGVGTPRSEFP